jgi:site-specific DNA recombinase
MPQTRALGIIRLSKKADPASTSLERQREIVEDFCRRSGMILVGVAEDRATSAFKIPPEKRRQVKEWLDRADEFDCIIFWRQDRLVRQPMDFLGIVSWCQSNKKALFSATEGTGDLTQDAGILIGFIKAWQSGQESTSTSVRVKDAQAYLASKGQWRGGRPPYGMRSICICHKLARCPDKKAQGYKLTPDEDRAAPRVREAARRVIAGESVHAVAVDFNKRRVTSADGKFWQSAVLRKVLRNHALMDGILSPQDFGQLQMALKERNRNRQVRTLHRDSLLLDIVYCGQCGGKIYRWNRTRQQKYFGRCRNEMKRGQVPTSCNAPMVPYDFLEAAVTDDLLSNYGEWLIETRITDATRQLRADEIDAEIIELSAEWAARHIDRAEFTTRQAALLDEQEELESASTGPDWQTTGETVAQRWERLSDAERRLWLLRIGMTWQVSCETHPEKSRVHRWTVASQWIEVGDSESPMRPDDYRALWIKANESRRERIVRPV